VTTEIESTPTTERPHAHHPTVRREVLGLDGLRAIAALMVLVFHFAGFAGLVPGGPLMDLVYSGWIGVDIFFAISGFVLFLPWARSQYDGSVVDRRRYLRNRMLRIVPAYWLNTFVLFSVGAAGLLFTLDNLRVLIAHFTFLAGYAIPGEERLLNGVTWTLYCEMAFYLLLPVIAPAFLKTRWLISVPLALAATNAYRWWALSTYGGDETMTRLRHAVDDIPATFDEFLMGMLLALLWARLEYRRVRFPRLVPPLLMITGAGGLYGTYLIWSNYFGQGTQSALVPVDTYEWLPSIVGRTVLAFFTAVFILGLGYRPNLLTRLFEIRPMVYLGLISYGLYLWHVPSGTWVLENIPAQWGRPGTTFLILLAAGGAFTLAWAAFSYEFVEKRFLAMKRTASKADVPQLARHARRRANGPEMPADNPEEPPRTLVGQVPEGATSPR
jgi:peptidoglycan/LPS O-acetylase OafA/YrhL